MLEQILHITEYILWILSSLSVIYLLIFTLASLSKNEFRYPATAKRRRIAVLFPAYREDRVIVNSVEKFTHQNYPKDHFEIVVISDHMSDSTNHALAELPIRLIVAQFDESSKAKALNLAIDTLGSEKYDIVVILDADNTVETDFLQQINNAFESGMTAIQAHRTAKNRDTAIATLDSISEEINNSIFRKGHVRLGLSSALIGSGMAFQYSWFKDNVKKLSTAGEDKELEILLLQQHVFIEYLEHTPVYDEKVQGEKGFYNQRRRWLATQYSQWTNIFVRLPQALFSLNFDYCDKLLQWLMPSRLLLLGGIGIMALLLLFLDWTLSLKWWGLLFVISITLCLAIPNQLVDDRFKKAIYKVPLLFIMMVINLFRIKGANKKFIHTEHGK